MSEPLPDYDLLADTVKRAGLEGSAAECHGALAALLCTVENLSPAQWLALYASTEKATAMDRESLATLGSLFEITTRQLDSPEFDFQVLLPDDSSVIDARVEAVSDWCQGFLLGLGLAGMADIKKLPADLPEVVEDFVKISRADSLSLDDEEASENAFAEIVEYIRVGVLMFRQEMKAMREQVSSASPDKIH